MRTTSNTMSTTSTFTFPASLTPYNMPPALYLLANPNLTNLVVSALILHNDRWECPGGCVDPTDASILHALCREVREETGLVECHVAEVVDTLEFDRSEETKWRKITFLVVLDADAEAVVQLDAREHVDGVWATEGDIVMGRAEGREIKFAYDAQRQTVLDVLRGTGRDGGDGGEE
ncbi:hypothetical protein C8A01DRAFT_49865 [Parachaetomium inaequale]|uniref:Nudix hydrolase domain-containing protein n=1 Tax=Parachaetomium inaequale TaxID=2588326 RepID=A0AAN6PA35_9PEZI|nr:hypothetical protein C8A01DRAFT_49865 [Parachaetomium inaequale]